MILKINSKRFIAFLLLSLIIFNTAFRTVAYAVDTEFFMNNDILYYNPYCSGGNETVQLAGKDNIEKVLNFFMQKGLSLAAASGFIGNMMEESNVRPDIIQGGGTAPENYTPVDGVGFGLVQWTFTARQGPLVKKAKDMDRSIIDIGVQLEYVWDELNSDNFNYVIDALKGTDNPREAALIIHGSPSKFPGKAGYEASMHYGNDDYILNGIRGKTAQETYDKYKDAAPISGSDSTGGTAGAPSSSGSSGEKATIALDPGHSVPTIQENDPKTGAFMSDYSNEPEIGDVWDVSQRVKKLLEDKGYKVVMTRDSLDSRATYRDRVQKAEDAGAAMGISIHTSPGNNEVYPQFVGGWRSPGGENDPKAVKFTNKETADKSSEYSKSMASGRSEVEGQTVVVKNNNFSGRAGLWNGNLPIISLISDSVPWVYNEYSGSGLSEDQKQKYAEGIANGVEKANPQGGKASTSNSCGTGDTGAAGGFDGTLKEYAWPKPIPNGDVKPTPGYQTKVIDRKKEDPNFGYIGGLSHPGIDCGGFVTRLIVDSGFDTGYNSDGKGGPTGPQFDWTEKNWEKIGVGPIDPAKLTKGDVANNGGTHTFIYVGEVDGFESDIASASLDSRAPAAGGDSPSEPGFTWFRKK